MRDVISKWLGFHREIQLLENLVEDRNKRIEELEVEAQFYREVVLKSYGVIKEKEIKPQAIVSPTDFNPVKPSRNWGVVRSQLEINASNRASKVTREVVEKVVDQEIAGTN